MSKGSEALKELLEYIDASNRHDHKIVKIYERLEIIEKELKRLDEYDNTEYSALIESHKKLLKEKKALEILKAFDFEIEDYTEDENGSVSVKFKRIILDDEEIDLLKEVLYEQRFRRT